MINRRNEPVFGPAVPRQPMSVLSNEQQPVQPKYETCDTRGAGFPILVGFLLGGGGWIIGGVLLMLVYGLILLFGG